MSELVARIPLEEDTLAYLQMLTYELDGLRALNCQLIRMGDTNGDSYQHFMKEYRRTCAEHHMAFAELTTKLALEWLEPDYRREVSFETGELRIYGGEKA